MISRMVPPFRFPVVILQIVHPHLTLVHFGRIFLLNHEGFYEPLRQLLQHYVDTGMMTQETMAKITFAGTPDEILNELDK
jgi:predicted Rossmann-fold nucleotide-binding protein